MEDQFVTSFLWILWKVSFLLRVCLTENPIHITSRLYSSQRVLNRIKSYWIQTIHLDFVLLIRNSWQKTKTMLCPIWGNQDQLLSSLLLEILIPVFWLFSITNLLYKSNKRVKMMSTPMIQSHSMNQKQLQRITNERVKLNYYCLRSTGNC